MPSLVTDSDKAFYVNALNDLFDTFCRKIKIIRMGERVVVSSNANHSFIYGDNQNNTSIEYTREEFIVDAVIRHGKKQIMQLASQYSSSDDLGGTDLRLMNEEGDATIKVRIDGYNALQGASLIELDGIQFTIDGPARPQLTFGCEFYKFILKRAN